MVRIQFRHVGAICLAAASLAAPSSTIAANPVATPFYEQFIDTNPCTGEDHTITVRGTFYEFERANGLSYRIDRLVTTSSGFSGGGTEEGIHDRVFKVTDLLRNPSGDVLHASATVVADPGGTVHVERFELRCL